MLLCRASPYLLILVCQCCNAHKLFYVQALLSGMVKLSVLKQKNSKPALSFGWSMTIRDKLGIAFVGVSMLFNHILRPAMS